jgi:hypothetical protein
MLQMLAEVVGTEEFLRVVALAKLVHGRQVLEPAIPVGSWEIGELFSAVPA